MEDEKKRTADKKRTPEIVAEIQAMIDYDPSNPIKFKAGRLEYPSFLSDR